jgi:hypothetical protein
MELLENVNNLLNTKNLDQFYSDVVSLISPQKNLNRIL